MNVGSDVYWQGLKKIKNKNKLCVYILYFIHGVILVHEFCDFGHKYLRNRREEQSLLSELYLYAVVLYCLLLLLLFFWGFVVAFVAVFVVVFLGCCLFLFWYLFFLNRYRYITHYLHFLLFSTIIDEGLKALKFFLIKCCSFELKEITFSKRVLSKRRKKNSNAMLNLYIDFGKNSLLSVDLPDRLLKTLSATAASLCVLGRMSTCVSCQTPSRPQHVLCSLSSLVLAKLTV